MNQNQTITVTMFLTLTLNSARGRANVLHGWYFCPYPNPDFKSNANPNLNSEHTNPVLKSPLSDPIIHPCGGKISVMLNTCCCIMLLCKCIPMPLA